MLTKISSTRRAALDLLVKALKILSSIKVGSKHFAYFIKLCDTTLKAIDRWFLETVVEKGIPLSELPDDFSITGLVGGTINKNGLQGADAEEVQATVFSQLPNWLDRFDPEKGKLINMIITNTKGRIRDYMNMQKEEREHAAPLVTEEGDSGVPLDLIEDIRDTSNSESDFQSLLKQVREYLYNRKERFGRVFDLLLEGRTGQEIQEALGVSRGYISQTMESIRKEIVTFARSIGNTDLESAAEAIGKKYFVHSSDYIRRFSRFLKSHIECA